MHNTRTDVLLSFFALRSANERRRELWSAILDESCFSCLLPVTPYRSFPASEVQGGCQRTVLGIDGAMSDTASLHVLLNSLIDRSRFPNAKVRFQYTLVTEDAVVAGNQMMARWVMTTLNAKEFGAKMEVSKRGMLSCKFNSAHKLTSLEMMFDVMAFMLQLKQAAGTDSFAVVPNTVQTCQRSFGLPMVMTIADRPHTIIQVNKLWEDMTGFKAEDVVGRASCRVLQGKETETANLDLLMSDVNHKRPTNIALTNYTKSGKRFQNHINVFPLSTDSEITHYIALTTYCGLIDGRGSYAPAPAPIIVEQEAGEASTKKRPGGTNEEPAKSALKKDAESIKTHQAVAPARQSSSSSSSSQQASGESGELSKPKVVVAGTTNRQDSSESNGGGDTISSLTSSLSSSNSDDGSNSNANSSSSASAPDAQKKQHVPKTTSTDTAAEVVSRKTVTTGSSMSSSASGSTSTNGSSSDEAKTETDEKTKRKRTLDATPAADNAKKQRVTRRG
jgi:PAS domain S-box-containing protein